MAKQINYLTLSYPNFVLGSVIDPEEANQNNADIANKVNEFVDEVKDAMLLAESSDTQSTEALDKANQAIADSASAVSTANTAKSTADNALDVVTSIESDYAILKPELQQAVLDAQTAIDDIEEYIDNTIFTKVGVVVSSGSIVATSDGITSFDIPSDKYNPLYDHIDLFFNGKLLEPTKDYIISNRTVNLIVGINNNQSIYYRAMKNVLVDPTITDGRNLLDRSISKSKLEDVLVAELDDKLPKSRFELDINNLTTTVTSISENIGNVSNSIQQKMDKVGGTMQGILKAQNNISYTVAQIRNIILSTIDPTSSDGQNGDIWIKYTP